MKFAISEYYDFVNDTVQKRLLNVRYPAPICLFPQGNNYFSFTPQYSGYYTLSTENELSATLAVNDDVITPTDGQYRFWAQNDVRNTIHVYGNAEAVEDNLSLDVANYDGQINIPVGESVVVKYSNPAFAYKRLSVSNSAATISDVLKGGSYQPYSFDSNVISPADTIDLAPQREGYYFVLANDSDSAPTTTELVFGNVDEYTGTSYSYTATSNWQFIKYTAPATGGYDVTFSSGVEMRSADEQGYQLSTRLSGTTMEINKLLAGQEIYVAIKLEYLQDPSEAIETFEISPYDSIYTWKVNGEVVPSKEIRQEVGTSLNAELWVNDVCITKFDAYAETKYGDSQYFDFDDGKITLYRLTTPVTYFRITAKDVPYLSTSQRRAPDLIIRVINK